jgi:hypothetical protein
MKAALQMFIVSVVVIFKAIIFDDSLKLDWASFWG